MTDFTKRYAAARKKLIAARFPNLNEEQLKAALATEGPLLLLAGAGSGKTTVLINRIANLITFGRASDSEDAPGWADEDDLLFLERRAEGLGEPDEERERRLCALDPPAPWNIIAITFTNKAANELKNRLNAMLGPRADGVWASTFHSACCRILRRDIERLGWSSDFTIYDSDDSERLMKEVVRYHGLDDKLYAPRQVLSRVSRAKDAGLDPAAFAKEAARQSDPRLAKIASCYAEYQKRLKSANALDFDDIILLAVRLLQEFLEVREYYQKKFRYVLVDEYQDTNCMQYELTRLLAGGWGNLCVVGDDDQSIYKFRGATIENILGFEGNFAGCRLIRLERNYRSTGHILAGANAVIRNNRGRKGKELWTKADDGEKITILNALDENDEAAQIASAILSGRARGEKWSDFAVLYRMNAQSNRLEYALKRNGVPYKVVGGFKFFERAEIKDMLSYLSLANNPSDDLRLRRVLNSPPRGIGAATEKQLSDLAASAGLSMYGVLSRLPEFPELGRAAQRLAAFYSMMESVRAAVPRLALDELYDFTVRVTGYDAYLTEKGDAESRSRLENVRELQTNILAYMKENAENSSLTGFLQEIALYTDLDGVEESDERVVLMTIHSAKGLEFPTVFLAGAEEGIFPSSRSSAEPAELEEERRLCYVAMTRAEKKLYVAHAERRMLYGKTTANHLSRFVMEIPESNVEGRGLPKRVMDDYSATLDEKPRENMPRTASRRPAAPSPRAVPPKPASATAFKAGDLVVHKAFGEGRILSALPVGNDALLDVDFSGVKKRLMANTASKFMSKK